MLPLLIALFFSGAQTTGTTYYWYVNPPVRRVRTRTRVYRR